jgi:hypothetical protein
MSINPLAYADAGEAKPFCLLVISIGMEPHSLLSEDATATATVIKKILAKAGFADIEVIFVESTVHCSVTAGPQLLSFDAPLEDVPLVDLSNLRRPMRRLSHLVRRGSRRLSGP